MPLRLGLIPHAAAEESKIDELAAALGEALASPVEATTTADYDAASDIERLAAGIELGMARLLALSQDSVLLFTKDRRRKRAARTYANGALQGRPAAPTRARH